MVMGDIGSFHCLEPSFFSRGADEGNKHEQGAMDTACIPKKQYFNCFIVPMQYIYARLFPFVELFMNI